MLHKCLELGRVTLFSLLSFLKIIPDPHTLCVCVCVCVRACECVRARACVWSTFETLVRISRNFL